MVENRYDLPSIWNISWIEKGVIGVLSVKTQHEFNALKSMQQRQHLGCPSIRFFGTTKIRECQGDPLSHTKTIVPSSSHCLTCSMTIFSTSSDKFCTGHFTGLFEPVSINVSPKVVRPGSPFQEITLAYSRIKSQRSFKYSL